MTLLDSDIQKIFSDCFAQKFDTQLVGGAVEPLYEPATNTKPSTITYREDFAASALHEVAHWCIAGKARRLCLDFGYTYQPPPRSEIQQLRFYAQELNTQTLEMMFAEAAGIKFQPSADDLGADIDDFSTAIRANQAKLNEWLATPAGERAHRFIQALSHASKLSLAPRQDSKACG